MRTRINIDSATPEEIKNLTTALQNVTHHDFFADDDLRHPHIWVHDGGMGWESPSISRQRAADVLREFDRLNAGLFDDGGIIDREPKVLPGLSRMARAVVPGDRPTGINPAVADMESDDARAQQVIQQMQERGFGLGARVWHNKEQWVVQALWHDETVGIARLGNESGPQVRVTIRYLAPVKDEPTVPTEAKGHPDLMERPDTGTFDEMDERDGKPTITDEVDAAEARDIEHDGDQAHVSYYASEDVVDGKPAGTWSVYCETYMEGDTEPIGEPTLIDQYSTEEEANLHVERLQTAWREAQNQ